MSKTDEKHESTYSRNLVNLKQDYTKQQQQQPIPGTPELNF